MKSQAKFQKKVKKSMKITLRKINLQNKTT